MATNDERREVAARLREYDSIKAPILCKIAAGIGLDCDGSCDGCHTKLLTCLADLIEPEPERVADLVPMKSASGNPPTHIRCTACYHVHKGFDACYCNGCGARFTGDWYRCNVTEKSEVAE